LYRGKATDAANLLVDDATSLIASRFVNGRHHIGAAILDADGNVFFGLHMEAMVGRAAMCAEPVALANAQMAGAARLELLVAIRHPKPTEGGRHEIVSPCGICREILLDYAPDIDVIVPANGSFARVRLADLLPHKYVGTRWSL
jgi:cytidine deaminase